MSPYTIRFARVRPEPDDSWDCRAWQQAKTAWLAHARPESSDHRPKTQARLLHDSTGIFGIFQVHDRYVRAVHTDYMSLVCNDSCVEFFVRPKPETGYFNFEFNCGGTMLCHYITDPARTPDGFKEFTKLPPADGSLVTISHTMPRKVDPEIESPTTWRLAFHIPFKLLEKYVGPLGPVAGRTWTGNFCKCGDKTSHPHWISWSPLEQLNFHMPRCFGKLVFE